MSDRAPSRDREYWPIRWSHSAALARTRLPQLASLIPVLGYAVLWSNQFSGMIMEFDTTLGNRGVFTSVERIQLLYLGSLTILVGLVGYWLVCPYPIREHRNRRDYLLGVREGNDTTEAKRAAIYLRRVFGSKAATRSIRYLDIEAPLGELSAAEAGGDITSSNVLSIFYERVDRSSPRLALFVFLLLTLGGLVFLLPSAEVLGLVLTRIAT